MDDVRSPKMLEGAYDAGHGHYLIPDYSRTRSGKLDVLWSHPECRGWHRIDLTSGAAHSISAGSVDDLENLTIVGSILCVKNGSSREDLVHGYIEKGRWRRRLVDDHTPEFSWDTLDAGWVVQCRCGWTWRHAKPDFVAVAEEFADHLTESTT